MAYKVFLDTNIILDIFHRDRPFFQDATTLFYHLEANRFTAYYSESVLTTMAYVLGKRIPVKDINEIIINLNKKIKLLPCIHYLVNKSLMNNPPDFEDALLYEIALHHQLDYFITSNIRDFKKIQKTALTVLKAKDFNKLL